MRRSLIVTPAGTNCNLRCDYCYNKSLSITKCSMMSEQVLRRLIETAFFENNTRFVWHGGEPLLAGKKFFRKVIQLQEQYGKGKFFVNSIQTNCTLIDDKWARFFVENNFYISTSIDGNKQLHDLHRKKANGTGSYSDVMRGVQTLLNYGCKRVGVVLVINKDNVNYSERVFNEMIINWPTGFEPNPCFETKRGDKEFTPSNDKILSFLKILFDMWWTADTPKFHIRLFKDMIRVLLGGFLLDCTFKTDGCRYITAIDENGDVYTCSRFLKEKYAYLGNILERDLGDIVYDPTSQDIYGQMVQLNEECKNCKWLKFCGGGCAYQRWLTGGMKSKYYACEVRKELFGYIAEKVKPYIV